MEKKMDEISTALFAMQNIMTQQGMFNVDGKVAGSQLGNEASAKSSGISTSGTTIYKNAVVQDDNESDDNDSEIILNFKGKDKVVDQVSQQISSDEHGDTSEELLNVTEQFIADCAAEAERRMSLDDQDPPANARAVMMLKEAEASKARMLATPGKDETQHGSNKVNVQMQASLVDENYLVVGAHVDQGLKQKIINHEYVDFARLVPRDHITREEDHRMELVSKGGNTYFVPVSDREIGPGSGISNFAKWEQAFRVFSNIYTKEYPGCSSELIQYNHIIYSASQSFTWDNVYMYDKEFRMHLSNYPQRSWSVILQQAWSMCLRDRQNNFDARQNNNSGSKRTKREPCRRFNKGLCTAGASCKYDHRCTVKTCSKWGHGAHICRKRTAEDGATSGNSNVAISAQTK